MFRQLRVAVVIPAYNEERAITEAISTVPEFVDTIIVVDDASTDATLRVASELGDIQVVSHPQQRGPAGARNTGLDHARGELVAFRR